MRKKNYLLLQFSEHKRVSQIMYVKCGFYTKKNTTTTHKTRVAYARNGCFYGVRGVKIEDMKIYFSLLWRLEHALSVYTTKTISQSIINASTLLTLLMLTKFSHSNFSNRLLTMFHKKKNKYFGCLTRKRKL